MNESLQNARVVTNTFLFRNNLSETLKTSKAINKSDVKLEVNPRLKAASIRSYSIDV